jgi:hypothetical protein
MGKPVVPGVSREDRIAPGNGGIIGESTIQEVIKTRLAYPQATQQEMARIIGISESTVARALTTPYARAQLTNLQSRSLEDIKSKVFDAQCLGVDYYHKSISRGVKEISTKKPLPQILSNARACTDSVSRITGLLKDNVLQLQGNLDTPLDYEAVPQLEADPDVTAFLQEPSTSPPEDPSP